MKPLKHYQKPLKRYWLWETQPNLGRSVVIAMADDLNYCVRILDNIHGVYDENCIAASYSKDHPYNYTHRIVDTQRQAALPAENREAIR